MYIHHYANTEHTRVPNKRLTLKSNQSAKNAAAFLVFGIDGSPTEIERKTPESFGDGLASFCSILTECFQALLKCNVCLSSPFHGRFSAQITFDGGAYSAILSLDGSNKGPNVGMVVSNQMEEPVVESFALVVCAGFIVQCGVVNVPKFRWVSR